MTKPISRARTINDVAAHAGVSLATVSRVMNGNPKVDPELAAKVHASAIALNYTASPLARSLVLGFTRTIAVVVPDLSNPTFQGALRGITAAAAKAGYLVLIADTFENATSELSIATEARRKCDAVILCAPRMSQPEFDRALRDLAPVVVINRETADAEVPSISADYAAGIELLLEHLYALGHRHIRYLAGLAQSASNARRIEGIRRYTDSHDSLAVEVVDCGVGFEDGFQSAAGVLASGATAAIAFNDLVAMGLLSAVNERKVAVPDQLSVVGFDDIPLAKFTTPTLTTARVSVEDLGTEAWIRLNALLSGGVVGPSETFIPELRVRASSGPVRSASR